MAEKGYESAADYRGDDIKARAMSVLMRVKGPNASPQRGSYKNVINTLVSIYMDAASTGVKGASKVASLVAHKELERYGLTDILQGDFKRGLEDGVEEMIANGGPAANDSLYGHSLADKLYGGHPLQKGLEADIAQAFNHYQKSA